MAAPERQHAAEMLYNEDGPVLLVRAGSVTGALALAAEEAADNDMAVTDTGDAINLGWVRATPCHPGGHEISGGSGWCDGGMRCHYAWGKPGPGAFRGTFINVRYLEAAELAAAEAGT